MSNNYREYQPGDCRNPNCQKDLGIWGQAGGRDKHYCDDKCRIAAFRARAKEKKGLALAQQIRSELRIEAYELTDETLALVARLADFGPGAIRQGVILANSVASQYKEKAARRGFFL